jgi:DNA-binding CsgD family transcriptional regulator
MKNNINKIIVICNSDIILAGMAEILTGCNSDEVILLHHSNELMDYPYLSGYILLIIPFNIFEKNERLLRRMFSNAKKIKCLYLNLEEKDENSSKSINIYDNKSLLINKINEFLNTLGAKYEDRMLNELTKREVDVLQLVSKGLANKEVADKLSISIHTVISHRKNISEKTGIKSASGLTMYAVLKKIIDIDEITTSDLI